MTDQLGAALDLARRGFAVFPVDHPELDKCAGLRTDEHDPDTCTERGKHPCVPFTKQATTDPQRITMWFAGALRNIGIACGASGVVTIDEDKLGAFEDYAASISEQIPETLTFATGRGRHFVFEAGDHELGNKAGELKRLAHSDVRGAGGYIVAPGSLHATGVVYSIQRDADVAPMPRWLVDVLKGPQKGTEFDWADWASQPRGLDAVPDVIKGPNADHPGDRHDVLVRYACSLRARDVPMSEALALHRAVWERCEQPPVCDDPLTWQEAVGKLEDVYQRYTPNHHRPEPDAEDAALDAAARFAREVDLEAYKLKVREAAQRKVRAAREGTGVKPSVVGLPVFLAVEDTDAEYRIEKVLPTGGRVVLAAQYKAGKSTLVGNVLRSLADGLPLLDTFDTVPAGVVLFDNELDERTLRRWLRDQGIENTAAVRVVSLRGRTGTFDILDPTTRAEWAQAVADADVVVFDCLRPVLDALGLSEDKDAGRFLVAFDALLAEAGVSEGIVVHHMGHSGERSRGDSRILDWPDATWKLVRQDTDDPGSARYFSAFGRDVDQPEGRLEFDPLTRRLRLIGGTRKESAGEEVIEPLLELLGEKPEGLSGRKVEEALMLDGYTKAAVRAALKAARDRGQTTQIPGKQNAIIHRLAPSAPSAPEVRQRTSEECASAPIGRAHTHSLDESEPAAHSPDFYDLFKDDPAVTLVQKELGGVVISEEAS
ncbi:MAG: bifunctional DNA primase/polymerase [Aeromicrobium sp.]